MNRLLIASLLLVLPIAAIAQGAPLEVKGIPLGATQADVQITLPSPECHQATELDEFAESRCRSKSGETPGRFTTWPDSFAGQPSEIIYHILNDKVGEITVAGLRADNYSEVLDALTAKYGTPTITHPQVQTKGGSSFENTVATWTRGKDVIVYDRYGRTMQYSWLRFTSGSYAEARKQWQASRATKAAADM